MNSEIKKAPEKKAHGVSPSFKARADSAAFYEAWVGATLARCGLYTVHFPFEADGSPNHGDTFDLLVCPQFRHDSDIYAFRDGDPTEIKSLNLTFSGAHDYPYNEVLVCSQNSFLRKWPGQDVTGRHFLLVSRETGNIVWIPKGTTVQFGKEVMDSERGSINKSVFCYRKNLKDLADFVEMIKTGGNQG